MHTMPVNQISIIIIIILNTFLFYDNAIIILLIYFKILLYDVYIFSKRKPAFILPIYNIGLIDHPALHSFDDRKHYSILKINIFMNPPQSVYGCAAQFVKYNIIKANYCGYIF